MLRTTARRFLPSCRPCSLACRHGASGPAVASTQARRDPTARRLPVMAPLYKPGFLPFSVRFFIIFAPFLHGVGTA